MPRQVTLQQALRVVAACMGSAESWCEDLYQRANGLKLQQAALRKQSLFRELKYRVREILMSAGKRPPPRLLVHDPTPSLNAAAVSLQRSRVESVEHLEHVTRAYRYAAHDVLRIVQESLSSEEPLIEKMIRCLGESRDIGRLGVAIPTADESSSRHMPPTTSR